MIYRPKPVLLDFQSALLNPPSSRRWLFSTVLMLYRKYEANEVEAAVDLAIKNNISTSDGVIHILSYKGDAESTIPPLTAWPSLPSPDITVYGQLGGVQ